METRDVSGAYNNIELVRLKDKLGTRQLPTAELLLDGATAHLVRFNLFSLHKHTHTHTITPHTKVGTEGRGVAHISPMLTVTRLHNSVISAAYMRRILQLSRDYCTSRTVFGRYLADQPLHMHTLAEMEVN